MVCFILTILGTNSLIVLMCHKATNKPVAVAVYCTVTAGKWQFSCFHKHTKIYVLKAAMVLSSKQYW